MNKFLFVLHIILSFSVGLYIEKVKAGLDDLDPVTYFKLLLDETKKGSSTSNYAKISELKNRAKKGLENITFNQMDEIFKMVYETSLEDDSILSARSFFITWLRVKGSENYPEMVEKLIQHRACTHLIIDIFSEARWAKSENGGNYLKMLLDEIPLNSSNIENLATNIFSNKHWVQHNQGAEFLLKWIDRVDSGEIILDIIKKPEWIQHKKWGEVWDAFAEKFPLFTDSYPSPEFRMAVEAILFARYDFVGEWNKLPAGEQELMLQIARKLLHLDTPDVITGKSFVDVAANSKDTRWLYLLQDHMNKIQENPANFETQFDLYLTTPRNLEETFFKLLKDIGCSQLLLR